MAFAPLSHSNADQAEEYRQLLVKLHGVFAANVRIDDDGNITEIHILGSSLRNPKQIMRDVQSALSSTFGIYVDHRVVSVAQLKEDPIPDDVPVPEIQPPEVRILCHEVIQGISHETNAYWVNVFLQANGITYTGKVTCKNTPMQRGKAAVNAALQAVNSFLGGEEYFQVLTVQQMPLSQLKVIVVALESLIDSSCPILIGAAENSGDEALSTVRATLDALNRRLGMLSRQSS